MTTINAVNSSYPFSVADGGTGSASLTAHGILVGEGTSAINPIVLTNGQMLIGSTGADPSAATITSTGSTLTVTTGAGTLNIDVTAPLTVSFGGTGAITLTAHGILVGEGTSAVVSKVLTNGQLLIGSTGADPVAASLSAGAGITITPGAGTITIASSEAAGGGFTWNDTITTSATLAAGNAYASDNVGLVTFTLPVTAAFGDTYIVTGKAAGGWMIAQNALQTIHFGVANTTTGTGGSLASTNTRDTVKIVCTTTNTDFNVLSSIGNITYV